MSWVNILIAMMPENLLLAGIVLAPPAQRQGVLPVSIGAVGLAAMAAAWLAGNGYAFAAFSGHYSVDPATLVAKAILLALAISAFLIARGEALERAFSVLLLSSLYGVCLLLSSDSFVTLFLGL